MNGVCAKDSTIGIILYDGSDRSKIEAIKLTMSCKNQWIVELDEDGTILSLITENNTGSFEHLTFYSGFFYVKEDKGIAEYYPSDFMKKYPFKEIK